jgi:O-acetyl-ADP-ribose deacetylase (regulator of RNase III)
MGGGVSYALLSAGGEVISAEARKHVPLKLGDVAVTSAGKLSAKYVFHAVTIDYEDMTRATRESVGRATLKCLQLADALGVRLIAFPAIGTGVAGFPYQMAAEVMTRTIADYLMGDTRLELVTITLYGHQREIDRFYESAAGLASVSTSSKRVSTLMVELGKIVARMNMPNLYNRVTVLQGELERAQRVLTESPESLEHLAEMQDHSRLGEITERVIAVSSDTQDATVWEDKQLEAEVLRTKLSGLLAQQNIQTSHLNRFQIEKAKYGGRDVPPRLEVAIEDMIKEISETEARIREAKTGMAALISTNA